MTLTAQRIAELKLEARDMKSRLGIKQTAGLAQIAQREGFRSWVHLMREAGGKAAVQQSLQDKPPTPARVARQERKRVKINSQQQETP